MQINVGYDFTMKKIFLSIIFLLVSTQLVFGKEVRTRFGFYINLPSNFFQFNANLDELLESDKEGLVNRDYFDQMVSGATKSDMDIEYLFPKKKYDPETNNINITMSKQDLKEIMAFTIDELCPEIKIMMEGLYNKRVKTYQCVKNPNNIKRKSSPAVYYFEVDGPFNNQRAHMVMLQTRRGYSTTFTLGCETKNCSNLVRDFISIINSRS